jgi:hypothetical protein
VRYGLLHYKKFFPGGVGKNNRKAAQAQARWTARRKTGGEDNESRELPFLLNQLPLKRLRSHFIEMP